jgi:hypothetical protein
MAADVHITCGKEQSLVVIADDNLQDLSESPVVDGTLVLSCTGIFPASQGIEVRVTVPALRRASVPGAGDMHIVGVSGDLLRLRLACCDLVCHEADVRASGAGSIRWRPARGWMRPSRESARSPTSGTPGHQRHGTITRNGVAR